MPELLIPAGSLKGLKVAVNNGADAVYLGLKNFNARINAENFSLEELREGVNYCHFFNVKLYIALNISLKDTELIEVERIIKSINDCNVDALIISDFAVLELVKKFAPNINLHASTQMGICNLYGAKFIEKLGFTRVILARECSLKEIELIKKRTNLEVEVFIHGSMCSSFSGGCLLSSALNGNSGNRGRCKQLCRLKYNMYNGESKIKDGYLMSLSDMCLIDELKRLNEIGVDSFKIEGRLKSLEYIAQVAKTYSNIIKNDFKYNNKDLIDLQKVFNRGGFSKSLMFKDKVVYPNIQNNIGIFAGKVVGKNKVCFKVSPNIGNGYKILRNNLEIGGFELNKISADGNGNYFIDLPLSSKVGDEIRLTKDVSVSDLVNMERRKNLKFFCKICKGEKMEFTAVCEDISYSCKSDSIVSQALTSPITIIDVKNSLSKLNNTLFDLTDAEIFLDNNVFVSKAQLNELRRKVVDGLTESIIDNYKNKRVPLKSCFDFPNKITKKNEVSGRIAVEINEENDKSYVEELADIIVFSPLKFDDLSFKKFFNSIKEPVYLKLPRFADNDDIEIFKKLIIKYNANIKGIYADNLYAVQLALELNKNIFAGYGLNIFNNISVNYFGFCNEIMLSSELGKSELESFAGSGKFVFSYGYLPLMNLIYCPYKNLLNIECKTCNKGQNIRDLNLYYESNGYKFPLLATRAKNCTFEVLNSVKTNIKTFAPNFNYYLRLINVDDEDIKKTISEFKTLNFNDDNKIYTNRFMKHGVY